MKRFALLVLLVAVCVSSSRGDVHAAGGGELGPDYVRATASDLGAGTFPGGGLPATAPSAESLFTWQREPSSLVCVILAGAPPAELVAHIYPIPGPTVVIGEVFGPTAPIDVPAGAVSMEPTLVPPGASVVGKLAYDVGIRPGFALVVPRCVGPGTPLLGASPSPAEVWQQVRLPRTRVHASPPGTVDWSGITRLATFFWGNAVPDTSARVSLRGFDVTVVAHPIAYAWSFGEGTTLVRSDPGSAEVPVAVTYFRRGNYVVQLFVVWEGQAHISFAGLPLADVALGTVTLAERMPYHVAEVRAVLRTTPGR